MVHGGKTAMRLSHDMRITVARSANPTANDLTQMFPQHWHTNLLTGICGQNLLTCLNAEIVMSRLSCFGIVTR